MLNFDTAVHKHTLWKARFRSAIDQKTLLDASAVEKDYHCDLGKWLLGDGRSLLGHHKSYEHCVQTHAEFHQEAAKIARHINEQKYDEAEILLGDESHFARLSYILLGAFAALESEANS